MASNDTVAARRRTLEASLEGIEGWLHPAEAWELYEGARRAGSASKEPLAVEIGSWKGRSTIALALGIKARQRGTVYAIDPVMPSEGRPADEPERRYAEFLQNLERAGVRDVVRPMRTKSHDARPDFRDGTIDVLFVDGDHEYDGVVQDIDDWSTALVDGAIVGFNDPFLVGVRRALVERAGRRGTRFRNPRLVVNSIFFTYRLDEPWSAKDTIMSLRLRLLLLVGNRTQWAVERGHDRLPESVKRFVLRIAYDLGPRILPSRRP